MPNRFKPNNFLDSASLKALFIPLIGLTIISVVLTKLNADITIQRFFWDQTSGWKYAKEPFFRLLYLYGPWPGLALAIGSLILAISSIWHRPWRRSMPAALFLAVCMLLGPGLVVNALFKPEWGRPRPKQIVEFGGEQPFRPFWEHSTTEHSRSFPSGHASTGFYWMAPYFLHEKRRSRAALCWLLGGIAFGGLIGLARMAQGSHFLTDILWAGGFVYASCWVVDRLVKMIFRNAATPSSAALGTTEPHSAG